MDATKTTQTSNFDPKIDLLEEDECDTLIIYLPGFKKEGLRVQLTNTGILKITGSRSFSPNQWTTFHEHFPIPKNCDKPKITAKFVDGILFVTLPKLQTERISNNTKEQGKSPVDPTNKPELRSDTIDEKEPVDPINKPELRSESSDTIDEKEPVDPISTPELPSETEQAKNTDPIEKKEDKGADTVNSERKWRISSSNRRLLLLLLFGILLAIVGNWSMMALYRRITR